MHGVTFPNSLVMETDGSVGLRTVARNVSIAWTVPKDPVTWMCLTSFCFKIAWLSSNLSSNICSTYPREMSGCNIWLYQSFSNPSNNDVTVEVLLASAAAYRTPRDFRGACNIPLFTVHPNTDLELLESRLSLQHMIYNILHDGTTCISLYNLYILNLLF